MIEVLLPNCKRFLPPLLLGIALELLRVHRLSNATSFIVVYWRGSHGMGQVNCYSYGYSYCCYYFYYFCNYYCYYYCYYCYCYYHYHYYACIITLVTQLLDDHSSSYWRGRSYWPGISNMYDMYLSCCYCYYHYYCYYYQ